MDLILNYMLPWQHFWNMNLFFNFNRLVRDFWQLYGVIGD